ncbi:transcriptional repressor, partial [Paracoccaceae bacterium]|nr:transcriptional repressor [Paracoccaceae bacterium]
MTAPKTDLETEWLKRGGLKPTRQRLALATSLIGDGR